MPQLTPLQRKLLLACSEDEVGLWEAVRKAKRVFPNADASKVRDETLSALQALLTAGLIQAGLPRADAPTFIFEPWDLPVDQIIHRVRAEWDRLGHEPDLGDIVWFVSTPEGDRALAEGQPHTTLQESEDKKAQEDGPAT